MMPRALVLPLASWFGLGNLPKAPGTFGTLGALPLWWALSGLAWPGYLAATAAFAGLAVWVSAEAEKVHGGHDNSRIVIDEVAGLLVAGLGVGWSWHTVPLCFGLFRLFDIWKPWPIRFLDRSVPGGLGVVLDDLAAGALACGAVHLGSMACHGG